MNTSFAGNRVSAAPGKGDGGRRRKRIPWLPKNRKKVFFSIVPPSVNIENVAFSRKKVQKTHGFMDFGQTNFRQRCQLFSFFTISALAIVRNSV